MVKRNKKLNYEKRIKEGRGSGEGAFKNMKDAFYNAAS